MLHFSLQCEARLGPDGVMSSTADTHGGGAADQLDPTYLQLFLLKHVCPEPGCFGTMVPLQAGATACTCNRCSGTVTEAQFLADLEQSI
jgi:hypothetical protein